MDSGGCGLSGPTRVLLCCKIDPEWWESRTSCPCGLEIGAHLSPGFGVQSTNLNPGQMPCPKTDRGHRSPHVHHRVTLGHESVSVSHRATYSTQHAHRTARLLWLTNVFKYIEHGVKEESDRSSYWKMALIHVTSEAWINQRKHVYNVNDRKLKIAEGLVFSPFF